MHVGVPKEVKVAERRVGLTPAGVRELASQGHQVTVQSTAGAGIGVPDTAYIAAGAQVAESAEAVWADADMIVKVKEPQAQERAMLREHQILFTYLHLAPDVPQTQDLLSSGATCIAYETVTDRMAAFRSWRRCRRWPAECRFKPERTVSRPSMVVRASSSAACQASRRPRRS